MKLVRDEPQQLLVLEAPALGLPPGVGMVVKVVVLGFALAPIAFFAASLPGSSRDPIFAGIAIFVSGIWLFGASRLFVALRRALRSPRRIRIDRYAGELEIEEEGLLDGVRGEVFRLERLRSARVATTLAKASLGDWKSAADRGPRPGVKLDLDLLDERERPVQRSLSFVVEGLDKREEVADLAYRLARAAGLPYSRVLRSDPREMEIELLREAGTGTETVPLVDAPADYARDRVMAQATRAAAQERIAAFKPDEFRGPARVTVWEPRQRVRFAKPMGFAAIGCLPFIALVLAGPAAFLFMREPAELAPRIGASAVIGVFGLIFGLVALAAVTAALPRRVTLDWGAQTLEVRGLFRTTSRPLSDISQLELKCLRTYHSGGKNSSAHHSYRCDVVAHLRSIADGAPATESLVVTDEFREQPEPPYRMSLPLASELAEALGVKRRVTDYS